MARERLAHHFGQSIGGGRVGEMVLVDRGVARWRVERQPERGLARCPDHPPQAQLRGGEEDVGVHRGVGGERVRGWIDVRRRNVGEVQHRVHAVQHVHRLPVLVRSARTDPTPSSTGGALTSVATTSYPWVRSSRAAARPSLPLAPVTQILMATHHARAPTGKPSSTARRAKIANWNRARRPAEPYIWHDEYPGWIRGDRAAGRAADPVGGGARSRRAT